MFFVYRQSCLVLYRIGKKKKNGERSKGIWIRDGWFLTGRRWFLIKSHCGVDGKCFRSNVGGDWKNIIGMGNGLAKKIYCQ